MYAGGPQYMKDGAKVSSRIARSSGPVPPTVCGQSKWMKRKSSGNSQVA